MTGICKPLWKKALLAMLVLCFGIQTGLVYSDERSTPLTGEALVGRALWHQHACQTCHQLYGQGGFLGPDLTNAASRVDSTRLVSLLTVGSGQMPALDMSQTEIAALSAYLVELDRPEVGRGQLRLGSAGGEGGAQAAFERAIEASASDPQVMAGLEALRTRPCSACHFPFRTSPVGAPDLSLVIETLAPDTLDRVLMSGRPALGMPPPVPPLEAEDRAAVMALLRFLNSERDALEATTRSMTSGRRIDWASLPWWEFP